MHTGLWHFFWTRMVGEDLNFGLGIRGVNKFNHFEPSDTYPVIY